MQEKNRKLNGFNVGGEESNFTHNLRKIGEMDGTFDFVQKQSSLILSVQARLN